MDESLTDGGSGRTTRRGAAALLTLAVVAASFPFMYYRMFSSFARYDDEGFLLLGVREFLNGEKLYSDVFSPYGPFFFLYKFGSFGAGALPTTHDVNRLLTLGEWGIVALLLGFVAYELTSSAWAAGAASFLSIRSLTNLAYEPGHPQGLLLILVCGSLLAGIYAGHRQRPRNWIVPGMLLAAMTLTKVNVGIFIGVAFALAMIEALPLSRVRWTCLTIVLAGAVVLPAFLMRPHLATWAGPYCAVATASILAAGLVTASGPAGFQRAFDFVFATVGGIAITIVTLAFTVIRGTPVAEAVWGWIISPMRIRSEFWSPAPIPAAAIPVALAAAAMAGIWAHRASQNGGHDLGVIVLRIVAVSGLAIAMTRSVPVGILLAYALPFTWLVVVPPQGRSWNPAEAYSRRLLCLVTVLHALVAYPVAGTQLQLATSLVIVVGVVCAVDALRSLRPSARWVLAPLALLPVAVVAHDTAAASRLYHSQTPLNLPGSSRIRLPHDQAAELQWLVANLRAHSETFVSLPGLNSLYLWTGEAPPTTLNVTAWMTLLDHAQQRRIAQALLSRPRACAVVGDYSFWMRGQDLSQAPLFRAVRDEFVATPLKTSMFTILDRRHAQPRHLDNFLLFGSREIARDDDRMAAPLSALQRDRLSLQVRFRTTRGGTIVSLEDQTCSTPALYLPLMYVGRDGHVYAQSRSGRPHPLRSVRRVNDGAWHHVIVISEPKSAALYLDGRLESEAIGSPYALDDRLHALIGTGYTAGYPSADDGWFPFRGTIGFVIANGGR